MNFLQLALDIREHAYAPYSKVKVGAVVVTRNGKAYKGANVENLHYGQLICAERNALYNAIVDGEKEMVELVVAANYKGELKPCHLCRSAIAEFCPNIKIKTFNVVDNQLKEMGLKDLYANSVSFEVRSRIRMWLRKLFP